MISEQEIMGRCSTAAEEFNQHEGRFDGPEVAQSLSGGLTLLRDSLFARVHDDVERRIGLDSMLAPISQEKAERVTKLEIEIYQIAVSAATVRERHYVGTDDDWYLGWLGRFRLGVVDVGSQIANRLDLYVSKSDDARRLAFGNALTAALPEARRAPLVLHRLICPAIRIATALAFGKTDDAMHWRAEQADCLPQINDCHHCRGKLLDNGETCRMCGNPLWKFEWLNAAD